MEQKTETAVKPRVKSKRTSKKTLPMPELLDLPDKGASLTDNPLARLWRIFLFKTGTGRDGWKRALDRYLKRRVNLYGSRAATWTRSNMSSRMCEDVLTFSQLMRGMDLMEFDEVEITIVGRRLGKGPTLSDGRPLVPTKEITASVVLDYSQISSCHPDADDEEEDVNEL